MKKKSFGPFMVFLYGLGLASAVAIAQYGWDYYTLQLIERPHHPLHSLLKPGGLLGHGLGILGSIMILLLFLYSARKRHFLGLRFGRMGRWLNVHIFFGVMGPILITLHTAMKFSGIVSISYFSMLAVMFSGIFGRYIYMQIPRDTSGDALTLDQISSQDQLISKILLEDYDLSVQVIQYIQQISGANLARSRTGIAALISMVWNDFKRPFRLRKLRRFFLAQNGRIPSKAMQHLLSLATQKSMLLRKRAFLDTANRIFHYWHVIHKPFAYVMVIIMFLHIFVTVTFGYTWIF